MRRLGYHFIEPAEGYLACGYEGKGRLPEPEKKSWKKSAACLKKDLVGEKLLITAGPNRSLWIQSDIYLTGRRERWDMLWLEPS